MAPSFPFLVTLNYPGRPVGSRSLVYACPTIYEATAIWDLVFRAARPAGEEVSGRLSRFYGDHEVVVSQLSTIEPEDYS